MINKYFISYFKWLLCLFLLIFSFDILSRALFDIDSTHCYMYLSMVIDAVYICTTFLFVAWQLYQQIVDFKSLILSAISDLLACISFFHLTLICTIVWLNHKRIHICLYLVCPSIVAKNTPFHTIWFETFPHPSVPLKLPTLS